jgi:hypothetical protein
VIGPDRLAGRQGEALAFGHGVGRPRLADAEAVDAPGLQVRDHLRRRHHHAVDVLQRMDALAGQPVIQPHGVGAGGEGLGEGQFCAMLVRRRASASGLVTPLRCKAVGQVDALAFWFRPMSTAMSLAGTPPMPRCTA